LRHPPLTHTGERRMDPGPSLTGRAELCRYRTAAGDARRA